MRDLYPLRQLVANAIKQNIYSGRVTNIVDALKSEPEIVADAVLDRYQKRSLDDPYWILPSGEKGAVFSGILERDGFGPSVHDDDFSWDEI